MSAITDQIPASGVYELVQSKVLETLQADAVLAAVVRSFASELPDENRQFGSHEVPRISCLTERKDQAVDGESNERVEGFQVSVSAFHQGLKLSELVTDAQRLAAYIEKLLEAEDSHAGGLSGLDAVIEGAEGSLMIGSISTEFFTRRHVQGNVFQAESLTACEIIITRPTLG